MISSHRMFRRVSTLVRYCTSTVLDLTHSSVAYYARLVCVAYSTVRSGTIPSEPKGTPHNGQRGAEPRSSVFRGRAEAGPELPAQMASAPSEDRFTTVSSSDFTSPSTVLTSYY